ncbi:MAG TPA: DUF4190 domain-containing protein [Candidatus Acidoferrales bacterium]|nr:DUF4190 domain-containing protein [Candidatus Acidoferrales bacterium]
MAQPPGPYGPPPVPQPYQPPAVPAYAPAYVPPTEGGAVWALVLGVLGFVACPIFGLIAFFLGGSALDRIRASGGQLQGDGIARAGRYLGCINVILWLLGLILVLGSCALGAASIFTQLPQLIPSPST